MFKHFFTYNELCQREIYRFVTLKNEKETLYMHARGGATYIRSKESIAHFNIKIFYKH